MKTKILILAIIFMTITCKKSFADYYWFGGTSTDWTDPTNWSSTYPTFTSVSTAPGIGTIDIVEFNSGYTYLPEIPASTNVVLGALYFNSGWSGAITIPDGSSLSFANMNNYSSYSHVFGTTGLVILAGGGSSGGFIKPNPTDFAALEIDEPINLDCPITISNHLLVNGNIIVGVDGSLTLLSPWDAVNNQCGHTAYIDGSSTANVIGNITVQRCVADETLAYHYLSGPVSEPTSSGRYSTAQTEDDFDGSVTPTYDGSYTYQVNPNANLTVPNFQYYDETAYDDYQGVDFVNNLDPAYQAGINFYMEEYLYPDLKYGWTGVSSSYKLRNVGTGISVILKTHTSGTKAHLLDWTGTANNGQYEVNVSYTDHKTDKPMTTISYPGVSNFYTAYYTTPLEGEGSNHNDGWNLLGNPYPSAIDLTQFLSNTHNNPYLTGDFAIFRNDGGTELDGYSEQINIDPSSYTISTSGGDAGSFFSDYQDASSYTGSYVAGTYTAADKSIWDNGLISLGQGFMAKVNETANESAILLFKNEMRTGDDPVFWKKEPIKPENILGIAIGIGHVKKDATVIAIDNNAKDTYQEGKDGTKLIFPGQPFSVYTKKGENNTAIQRQPALKFETVIPLDMKVKSTKGLVIGCTKFSKLNAELEYVLEDRLLNKFVKIDNSGFNYPVTSKTNSIENRFFIHIINNSFKNEQLSSKASISVFDDQSYLNIRVNDLEGTSAQVQLSDLLGRLIVNQQVNLSNGFAAIPTLDVLTGIYNVSVKTDTHTYASKVMISK